MALMKGYATTSHKIQSYTWAGQISSLPSRGLFCLTCGEILQESDLSKQDFWSRRHWKQAEENFYFRRIKIKEEN